MVHSCLEIQVAGETLVATPWKTLYWPARHTLFVADLHLGKAAAFRAGAIPVPSGTTNGTLERLSIAIEAVHAKRVVLLGDLWHAKEGLTEDVLSKFIAWRRRHAGIEVALVEGNHDLKAGPVPNGSETVSASELREGPFVLRHHPDIATDGYVLAGHMHPCAVLTGAAKQSVALPCFWFQQKVGILPAFGDFTGSARIRPKVSDRVLAVCDGQVFQVGKTS